MTDSPSPTGPAGQEQPPKLDISVSHPARVWNYWLGGKDNYPVDREVGERCVEIFPGMVDIARAERAFLVRAVTHLVEREGVRQLLDIGTGLPAPNNTHEVAQSIAPETRIVYVDNDPLVLLHAQALLVGTPEGVTDYIEADLRDPDTIIRHAREKLDFSQPVALLILGVLGLITETAGAYTIVDRLVDALPSGSFLVICDGTNVGDSEAYEESNDFWNEVGSAEYQLRSSDEIARFFDGLELLEPGVVSVPLWRPNTAEIGVVKELDLFGGVGRKR